MKSFLQKFSVIDFLGIFFPGAIFTLMFQMDYPILRKPFEAFFGKDQTIMLGFYFVGISYILGSIFHECGSVIRTLLLGKSKCKNWIKALEFLRLGDPGAVHKKHLGENGDAVKTYKTVFPGKSDQELLNGKDCNEAGRKVYRYVRQKGVGDTAVLLTSIAAMFRSLVCVDLALILLALIRGRFGLAVVYLMCLPLFCFRWKHFADAGAEYAYLAFLQLKNTDEYKPNREQPDS